MTQYLRPCLAEMVGVFFLVFVGAGSICTDAALRSVTERPTGEIDPTTGKEKMKRVESPGIGLLGIAVANGLALSIAVSATMNVSGGYLNPAVTIAMWVYKKIETDKALFYILFQLLGGIIAALLLLVIFKSDTLQTARFGTPFIDKDMFEATGIRVSLLAIAIEIVLTFLLVFAIFGTALDPRAPKVGGFGIGLAAAAAILVGGPLTGAAMNPSRAFGPALLYGSIGTTSGGDLFKEQLTYWVGPIVGAILAAGLYLNYIMEPEKTGEAK